MQDVEDDLFGPGPVPASRTALETIEDLLEQSRRSSVPIRHSFLQTGRGPETLPGPMGRFVTGGDARGLDLYLLIHAVASAAPWDCTYPSHTWARALGLPDLVSERSAKAAISKALARIADRKLIRITRSRRLAQVTLLKEDGSGDLYERPRTRDDRWLRLPHEYWSSGFYTELELPAKAVLLIALSMPDAFSLPLQYAPAWYGIGSKTAQRGLAQLIDEGILRRWVRYQVDPTTVTGWARRNRYALNKPFARDRIPGSRLI